MQGLLSQGGGGNVMGASSRKGKNCTLRHLDRSQAAEFPLFDEFALLPRVVAGQIDMF